MKSFALLSFLFFNVFIWAQTRTKVYGVIFANNQTQEGVLISNLKTKQRVISNKFGKFVIEVNE